ncbi:MAG: helix-turn-helix transcriptional regulator [Byssovorax sp.]
MSCAGCKRTEELAALALSAPSQRDYRAEALRRLIGWVGADAGLIHQHFPTTAPLETGIYEQMDMDYVERCVANWDEQYCHDMAPVVLASRSCGGASIDARSLADRGRLSFYNDIIVPTGVREGMFCHIELGGASMALCFMNRSSKPRFDDIALTVVRGLLPLFSLGDGLLGKRAPAFDDEVRIAELSRREREVAELMTRGYTNREIALALGSSVHTVRNQVASLFRKAGASTRAELVGIILGSSSRSPR